MGESIPFGMQERLWPNQFTLSSEEKAELLPSGRQPIFDNRVAWAKSYLQQAGVLEPTRRAHFQITERGQQVLSETSVTDRHRSTWGGSRSLWNSAMDKKQTHPELPHCDFGGARYTSTPEETLEAAYQRNPERIGNRTSQASQGSTP